MQKRIFFLVIIFAISSLFLVSCEEPAPFYPVDRVPETPTQYLEFRSAQIVAIEWIEDTDGETISVLYLQNRSGDGEQDFRTQIKVVNKFIYFDDDWAWDFKLEHVHDDVYRIVEMVP